MGTSGSFNGSSSKNAIDLRDNIAEWLDELDTSESEPSETEDPDNKTKDEGNQYPIIKPATLFPALRIIAEDFSGSKKKPREGRSYASTGRSSGKTVNAAGKAGSLALAYVQGRQEILKQAGLDYEELKNYGDSVSISSHIVDAIMPNMPDGTIGDAETRVIAAKIVSWVINESVYRDISPEEIVRKAIETNIAEVALTEVTASINGSAASIGDKCALEREIRQSAVYLASQAKLTDTGASSDEITQAIEEGIRSLVYIYGGEN